jgi:hypothetical protein
MLQAKQRGAAYYLARAMSQARQEFDDRELAHRLLLLAHTLIHDADERAMRQADGDPD